jgi:Ca-activated chloride channel homolog
MLFWIIYCFSQLLTPAGINAAFLLTPERQNTATHSQQEKPDPPQSDSIIRATVTLVSVDSLVRNRKGGFVDDLKADDFIVYDKGVAQQIALFSQTETPLDIALVVDNSGSEERYILQLRKAALTVLKHLNPENDRVALFCFGTYPIQLTGLTLDRFLLAQSLNNIPGMLGTNIKDALWDAAQYLRLNSKQRRRAIILISDNYENAPFIEHSSKELLEEMLETGITLYSIKTRGDNSSGSSKDTSRLVEDTGGEILNIAKEESLSGALNAAITRLKHSYLLGFYPSKEGPEGSYHELNIKLSSSATCPACTVQARKGYYSGNRALAQPSIKKQWPRTSSGISAKVPITALPGMPIWFLPDVSSAFAPGMYEPPMAEIKIIPGSANTVFQNYQTAIKQWWSDKTPILQYLNIILAEAEDNKYYKRRHNRISFKAAASRLADTEDNQKIKIDLKFDAAPLFFFFSEGQHKCWLVVAVVLPNASNSFLRLYEVKCSEEKFRQALQSGVSLSLLIPIPAENANIEIIVLEPFSASYGLQYAHIQPSR